MSTNRHLDRANKAKNDDYYTRLADVSAEMRFYQDDFRGQILYFNCDDPRRSAFWTYFHQRFHSLGLRAIYCTGYNPNGHGYFASYTANNGLSVQELDGNGSYHSIECLRLLRMADIVITNPPFSILVPYFDCLLAYQKRYIIVGTPNCLKYLNIAGELLNDRLSTGVHQFNAFHTPATYLHVKPSQKVRAQGQTPKTSKDTLVHRVTSLWIQNVRNVDAYKRKLKIRYTYRPGRYQFYDNLNAVECKKIALIPKNCPEIIGVPLTFPIYNYKPYFRIVGGNHYSLYHYPQIARLILPNSPVKRCLMLNDQHTFHRWFVKSV